MLVNVPWLVMLGCKNYLHNPKGSSIGVISVIPPLILRHISGYPIAFKQFSRHLLNPAPSCQPDGWNLKRRVDYRLMTRGCVIDHVFWTQVLIC